MQAKKYNENEQGAKEERGRRAIALLTEALRLEPENAEALVERGRALCLLGRHNEAIVDQSRALELRPGYVRALID